MISIRTYLWTVPVSIFGFSSTVLAQDGLPETLTNLSVDQSILDTVSRELPEQRAIGAEFLDEQYSPNLNLNEQASVSVTFISEGAGYRNSLGYFTYSDDAFSGLSNSDIDTDGSGIISAREMQSLSGVSEVGMIFDNASGSGGFAGRGGSLNTGDTVVLGNGTVSDTGNGLLMTDGTVFDAGTNVGFFLSANAWNGTEVNGWDNDADPNTYWSLDFLNPENDGTATIEDVSSDTRHVAMLQVEETGDVILGFEDLNRATGDNDFNDAVFIVRSDPYTAITDANVPQISAAPGPVLGGGLPAALVLGGVLTFWRRRGTEKA